jgi:DNA-binding LacI/PurR family transcriptional regulator
VFAASDLIAIGAMRAFQEAGLVIPRDIALVGFDDIPVASLTHPRLTTIAQDYVQAGSVLVEALISKINGRPIDGGVLAPRLIIRQSSAPKVGVAA